MRKASFFLVALLAITLPCVEIPESAGVYDDASNDFVLPVAGIKAAACITQGDASRSRKQVVDPATALANQDSAAPRGQDLSGPPNPSVPYSVQRK